MIGVVVVVGDQSRACLAFDESESFGGFFEDVFVFQVDDEHGGFSARERVDAQLGVCIDEMAVDVPYV